MTTNEAMKILGIKSRNALSSYARKGYVKVSKLSNGRYIYEEDSIQKFLRGSEKEDINE